MALVPLSVQFNATIVAQKKNPVSNLFQQFFSNGIDWTNFIDQATANDGAVYPVQIVANGSISCAMPPGCTSAKFIAWKFNVPVALSGMITNTNTRYGLMECNSGNTALTITAGADQVSGILMILGA